MPSEAHCLPTNLRDCGRNITPIWIRALYGIPLAHLNDSVNSFGLYEDGDHYAQANTLYAPNVPNGTAPIPAFIDGAQAPVAQNDPANIGESDIDIYMTFSLIHPQTSTLSRTDDPPSAVLELEGKIESFLNTFLNSLDGSCHSHTYDGLTGDSPGIDASSPDELPGKYSCAGAVTTLYVFHPGTIADNSVLCTAVLTSRRQEITKGLCNVVFTTRPAS